MKINYSPVSTTRNYGINYYEVPDSTFDDNNTFCESVIEGSNIIASKEKVQASAPICEESKKQAKISGKIVIKQSNDIAKIHFTSTENKSLAGTYLLEIDEYASRNIIIDFSSNSKMFANINLLFDIKKSANANVILFSSAPNSQIFLNIEANAEENSHVNFVVLSLDANEYVLKHSSKLAENANCTTKCLYLGSNSDKIDLNIISEVYGKFAKSTINVVGLVAGNAIKNFKGTIDFKKGSTKSFGDEKELCLMLSPNAKSKALPMLLCAEEDVEGSHSTATGKIDDKSLFYIMSRGISKNDAIKMMSLAKFAVVTNDIFDESTKNNTIKLIERKLENEQI